MKKYIIILIVILSSCTTQINNNDDFRICFKLLNTKTYIGKIIRNTNLYTTKVDYFFNDVFIEITTERLYLINYENDTLDSYTNNSVNFNYLENYISKRTKK